jgi:outer membrane protein assembly factor BamB
MITVTKPAGGETWAAGSTHNIEWDSYGITGAVDISYSTNDGVDWVMIDSTANTSSYSWPLPAPVDSNQCLVSVEPNIYDPTAVCTASDLFTIIPYSAGPPIAAKWKSLGGDFDRSGLSAHLGPEIGCIKWQFQTSAPVSASVTVADNNTVNIACEDGNLYTLDANDGSLLGTYEVNSPLLSSPTIGPDGTVYVGAQNGTLYAIDVNGYLRWTHTTDGFIYSSPAVSPDGNNIYVCSQDGSLYALARDGSELWSFQTAGPGVATGAIFASPAVGPDGTVYIAGVYDPNLYALDPNTGSVIWDCNFLDPCDPNGDKPWPFASPVVAPDGTIYQVLLYNPKRFIGGLDYGDGFWYDSKLYAIDPNDGGILWATNMSQTATDVDLIDPDPPEPNYWFEQYYSDMTREERIPPYPYTRSMAGKAFVRYYRVSNSSYSEPALGSDGTIYVSLEDQYIRAVDPNGTIKGVTSLGTSGGFTLTIGSDGLIYAAGDDGLLYVVDPDDTEIARYQALSQLSFPVITADGTIIVNDANNTVTAIIDDDCPGRPPALHRPEDLNIDWQMNFLDFGILAADWLDCTDTSYDPQTREPYCDYDGNDIFLAGDINWDHYVDAFDLEQLAMRWLAQD